MKKLLLAAINQLSQRMEENGNRMDEGLIEAKNPISSKMAELSEFCMESIAQITIKVVAMKKEIEIMKAESQEMRTRMDAVKSRITIRVDEVTTRIDSTGATMAEQYTKVLNDISRSEQRQSQRLRNIRINSTSMQNTPRTTLLSTIQELTGGRIEDLGAFLKN